MTASSLYNMVDSIFIGQMVGPLAISGLALTFPLMNLAAAFGSLVGVGAATLISMRLGQRDYDTARRVLGNVVVLNAIIPRPDSLLLRRQRSDGRLRPRIHDHHPAGQCGDPHVLRAQRRAPRLGPPPAIHVCDHQHRHHQHGARCAFHLRLRLGHPRSRHRHGAGAGRVARMAVPHPFGQTRTAPFQPRHLPAQETHRARHHGHRHVAVSDEPRGVLHRHP